MPNWCSNHVYITIKNTPESTIFIKKLMDAHDDGMLNRFLVKTNDSRADNIDKWGTKWDIDPLGAECFDIDSSSDTLDCNLSYQTAWSPNVPVTNVLYKKLAELDPDATMEHTYDEPGCAFYGISDGKTDDSYDMNIAWSIKEEICDYLELKSKVNNILTFENKEGFFLIKEVIKKEMNYYEDDCVVNEYICFSETYGDCSLYEHGEGHFYCDNLW